MSIHQLLLASYRTPVPTGTWNPSDKGASVVLSGGNLVASVTAAISSVRATVSHSSGHYYFEVTPGGVQEHLIGIAKSTATLSSYPGADSDGWSYYNSGQEYHSGTGSAYGASFAPGDVIGVEYNSGSLYFWKNGTVQASGTAAFTGITGSVFPMWGPGSSGAGTRSATINVGGSAFAYSLPSGASAWG